MLKKPLSLGLIQKLMFAMLVLCTNAFAAPTEYQITGTGSGTIGANSFSNQAFDIEMFGDPSNVTVIGIGVSNIDPLSSALLSVPGIGVATLSIPTRLGINSGVGAVFFSRSGVSGLDLFDFHTSLSSLNGPFSVTGTSVFATPQFNNVASSMGTITFTSASSPVTFSASAAPVPEPETYAMLLAGLGLLGFIAYRRKDDSSNMPMAA